MFRSKIIVGVILVVAATCSTTHGIIMEHCYEEPISYSHNPKCAPGTLDKGIRCDKIGKPIAVTGGLYDSYGLHYVPLASAYYVARYADALGFQRQCPSNTTFLKQLDIQTPWSGAHGAIAIDSSCGYNDLIRRYCTFPTDKYPFLCTGIVGTPGTYGKRLETLSYISILEGANERWTLFAHCWRAKTPNNPDSAEIATSFNVFSLDPVLPAADRKLIMKVLKKRGFNTRKSNIIEFDYKTNC